MTQRRKWLSLAGLAALAGGFALIAAEPPSASPPDSAAAPAADPNKVLAEALAKRAVELCKTGRPEDQVLALKLLETAADLFPDKAVVAARDMLRVEVAAAQAKVGTAPKPASKPPDGAKAPSTAPGPALVNSIGATLVYIPAGTFIMGSPAGEGSMKGDEVQHRVTLTKGFYMGKTEVTQVQWQAVMGNNPSSRKGDTLPVTVVTWDDCVAFCRKLSEKEGKRYRLPTEAEWEYACRAGTTTPFHTGETLDATQANFRGSDLSSGNGKQRQDQTAETPVATFAANAFGLNDMHGNVGEWCSDWYGPYAGDTSDPVGPAQGAHRVLRGGTWNDAPGNCRSAFRSMGLTGGSSFIGGFRLALESE